MGGIDFLLPKRVDRHELREVLIEALEVRSVEVVGDPADAIGDQEALAVVSEVRGEFRTLVELFPRGDVDTVKAVARAFGSHALAPDDGTDDPYAMLLVSWDGREEHVLLAADDEEYRLV